jgi:hypothetical protein
MLEFGLKYIKGNKYCQHILAISDAPVY